MQFFFILPDVEIQKTRKADKINPAYSPDQSEPESPGKLIRLCILRKIFLGEENCVIKFKWH
jgi:hypothetical protein